MDNDSTYKSPGEWAAEDPDGSYDCTGEIGPLEHHLPLLADALWPMYSFARPSHVLWNAIAGALNKRGWTDEEIKGWLQSKHPRHELDGKLGDDLEKLGDEFAKTINDSLKVELAP